jgi:hypothetical protein
MILASCDLTKLLVGELHRLRRQREVDERARVLDDAQLGSLGCSHTADVKSSRRSSSHHAMPPVHKANLTRCAAIVKQAASEKGPVQLAAEATENCSKRPRWNRDGASDSTIPRAPAGPQ